jgi:apolipoprotein N-acyltransferase
MQMIGALGLAAISVLFWVISLPPWNMAEAAYLAWVPWLLYCFRCPAWKPLLIGFFLSSWAGWIAVLFWLRHVTYFGMLALAAVMALFFVLWAAWTRWQIVRLDEKGFLPRLLVFAGCAAAWVLLEQLRGVFLSGFPWAPLALSQWERPLLLQIAAWTGAQGVSALLIFFNLLVAWSLRQRFRRGTNKSIRSWFSPELYLALSLLLAVIFLFFRLFPERMEREALFRVGFVQPFIAADLKWEPDEANAVLDVLERQTQLLAHMQPEVMLWPEAVTPWPALGNELMRNWIESLVSEIAVPVLMGNLAVFRETNSWYNAAFAVSPETGLDPDFYAKRKLVPFGEFVPLRRWLPFINKLVPVGDDFQRGQNASLLLLQLPASESVFAVGALICYEDVFSGLARDSVRAGADFLFVATNNAWFGEGGGAYQHAAHSVLRAVENRRPVLRCGNGGWSGWIDEWGSVRYVLSNEHESIYFRGGGAVDVERSVIWQQRLSFYTRYPAVFNWVCGFFLVFAGYCSIRKRAHD